MIEKGPKEYGDPWLQAVKFRENLRLQKQCRRSQSGSKLRQAGLWVWHRGHGLTTILPLERLSNR